jgi:1-acyl-sn-glycerol-3-phosphate acyltransferase
MQALEKKLDSKSNIIATTQSANTITIVSLIGEILRQTSLFPIIRSYTCPQIYHVEQLSNGGPYIFAANHCSHLDTPLLLAALPSSLRLRVRVAAAADYFFDRRSKAALMRILLNAFPFVRKGPQCTASLEYAQQLLASGYSILLFPEGTRSKDGQLQPFKHGIGKLALTGLAPVVPVWIEGTYAAMPKGARWPRHQQVSVRFGAPTSFSPGDNFHAVVTEIEQQVRTLSPANITARKEVIAK